MEGYCDHQCNYYSLLIYQWRERMSRINELRSGRSEALRMAEEGPPEEEGWNLSFARKDLALAGVLSGFSAGFQALRWAFLIEVKKSPYSPPPAGSAGCG
jgi:hypothetical protein